MSEKKPLADELLREILARQFIGVYGDYTIDYSIYNVIINFNHIADAERFAGLEGGVGIIVHGRIVLIDLYRLSAMGRKWAAEKGYPIELNNVYVGLFHEKDDVTRAIQDWPLGQGITELSATFAAISAVWERVKG